MKKLSIFVDESGDFGEYDVRAPYYIISIVLHEQDSDISADLNRLEEELRNSGYENHCVHMGPLIRRESDYKNEKLDVRQRIAKIMMSFFKHIQIRWKSFYIEKRHIKDAVDAVGLLAKELSFFVKEKLDYLQSFDNVVVYYDNGQVEVNKILSSVFNSLLERVEFRKVIPSDYRLFQVTDLVCTLMLTELKMKNHNLSVSEYRFFDGERVLKKNYLKPFHKKEI